MPEDTHSTESTATQAPQVVHVPVRSSWKQNAGIPVAIVIGAIFIAGSIYLSSPSRNVSLNVQNGIDGAQNVQQTPEMDVLPVTDEDHIQGNPNAPIVIVEYSDYDCPFCRVFHDTMSQVMQEYGDTGNVAWVYRHYPIVQLHPNAPKISEAAYCVEELAGNDGFWKFTNALNESREVTTDANGNITKVDPTDMGRITEFALAAGIDKSKFELCYNSGKYTEKVEEDVVLAGKAGAQGTPYSVVLVGDQKGVLSGAQSYDTVKQILDNLISQVKSGV